VHTGLDLLRSSLEAVRTLEAGARERGSLERAETYAEIARRYEAEIARLEEEQASPSDGSEEP
jgi:hypothetical protein